MEIFIILLLILLNGLFAMSEIALISARKSNLTAQAKQGNKRARQALKLAAFFLLALLVVMLFTFTLASMLGMDLSLP